MTVPAPEALPFAWLPVERVQRWLQLDESSDQAQLDVVEDCRRAAASYCEDARRDLIVVELDPVTGLPVSATFTATERIVQAAVLAAAMHRGGRRVLLQRPASRDEPVDDHDQRDHEQDVNQAACHREDEEPEQPQHQQDDDDRPEHDASTMG